MTPGAYLWPTSHCFASNGTACSGWRYVIYIRYCAWCANWHLKAAFPGSLTIISLGLQTSMSVSMSGLATTAAVWTNALFVRLTLTDFCHPLVQYLMGVCLSQSPQIGTVPRLNTTQYLLYTWLRRLLGRRTNYAWSWRVRWQARYTEWKIANPGNGRSASITESHSLSMIFVQL